MSDKAPVPVHLAAALDGLAENPGLPAELVRRLVGYRRGFGRVAERADLTTEVIAEIIAADHHWLVHTLALNSHIPDTVRLRLAEHRNPAIRAASLVGGRDAARDLFERLINDPDKQVRQELAECDHVPADLRARMAGDSDPEIRATLARWWPQAPEEVRRILLTDPVDQVRAAACSTYYSQPPHPVPPADLVPILLDDPVTRVGAVRHCTLTAETALRLSNDPNHQVRRQVAEHPQLSPKLRDTLAEDPSASVRVGIFARRDTPESIRYKIYAGIQRGSGPLTDMLDDDLDDDTALQEIEDFLAVTELRDLPLPWVTADPLPHVGSPYVCFRLSAARSRSLPVDAVTRLLHDDESNVRTTMARHAPHLVDQATAERIDRDFRPCKRTRWRPADDFTFSPQTLRRFATDPDPRMRCLAPRDPDLPTDLAEHLAADSESSVRRTIAAHPRLPTHALITLLTDQTEWVTRAAAASPSLPVVDMERLLLLAGL
ncbi:hypothetical protein OOK41_23710 [Micromonospora sp. NBC_01655]|uniref:hypothetical protein n=1 Tax=Micromonospora sp. NBC_01655 TaxID=2975983 RepID=UPI00225051D3|nr:hypothetical protein [Micromonospora sp. NBC_01655]MCX4473275.1 hypothetical protein [Micromonospora sp. NBC_01655]